MVWDWALIAALVSAAAALAQAVVIVVTLPFIFRQLREMRRATLATALQNVFSYLQDPEARNGRHTLYSLAKPELKDWTDEEVTGATLACNAFDMVGIFAANEIIGPEVIVKEYRGSIVRCWENATPLVTHKREQWGRQFGDTAYWNNFEMLYRIAKRETPDQTTGAA